MRTAAIVIGLYIVAVLVLLWLVWRANKDPIHEDDADQTEAGTTTQTHGEQPLVDDLSRCPWCGLQLPEEGDAD